MESKTENKRVQEDTSYGWKYVKEFFLDIIDLKKGVDKQGTIEEIKAKKSMSGANAWMLMCSIIIASIGLDRNSDAVIIGAMLISPLMSPILGIGLGIGINDKEVVKKSVLHFATAIFIALITSYIYFRFSPFGQVTPAIAARTEPLTLDVLVAIFGGVAGIISIARKDISTTLPGVAIATALMPPLCVTGFGLATENWTFALNSFYLFILNTSFISLSTYLIIRYLRFPYRRYVNPKERLRNRFVVVLFSLIIIIPSFLILQSVLDKVNTKIQIKQFVDEEFGTENIYLDSYVAIETDSSNTLFLKVRGDEINTDNINQYQKNMSSIGLSDWKIQIIESSEVDFDEITLLSSQIKELELVAKQENERRRMALKLQKIESDSIKIMKINREFSTIFDGITNVAYAKMDVSGADNASYKIPTFIISVETKIKDVDIVKMEKYIKLRYEIDTLRMLVDIRKKKN